MREPEPETNRLWTFPEGMLDPEDSLKGFSVEAADGDAGEVAWASYAPGESYLVVISSIISTRRATSFRPPRLSGSASRNGRCGFA